jgi:hypothetical protein
MRTARTAAATTIAPPLPPVRVASIASGGMLLLPEVGALVVPGAEEGLDAADVVAPVVPEVLSLVPGVLRATGAVDPAPGELSRGMGGLLLATEPPAGELVT